MILKFLRKLPLPVFLNNDAGIEKWVIKQLKELKKGQSLLDAGAGESKYKKWCKHLTYVSQDFAQYDGKGDGKGLQTSAWDTSALDIVSDIIDIPVEDASFDAILCSSVLEHIPYPNLAIGEFSRILRPGGRLILTAPFASITHFAPYFFCTGFSPYWYSKILEDNGFKLISITPHGNFFDYLCQELLRLPVVLRKYSVFGSFAVLFYPLVLPVVAILYLISFFSRNSSEQLCFGHFLIAERE